MVHRWSLHEGTRAPVSHSGSMTTIRVGRRRQHERQRLGGWWRCGLIVAAAVLAAVLGVARWLEPDPRGLGTHEQLGLPPCLFLRVTGKPCMSCGMTTAFAWVTRGRLDHAVQTHLGGAALAVLSLALVPWMALCAALGRSVGVRSVDTPLVGSVTAVVALSLAAWSIRLLFVSLS